MKDERRDASEELELTELEWSYQPADFFEARYTRAESDCDLLIEGGRIVATLRTPRGPIDESLKKRIAEQVHDALLVRQL